MKWIELTHSDIFADEEIKCEWEDTDEGFEYEYLSLLELGKRQVYIEIDGQPTYWMDSGNIDGFMIFEDVREVRLEGSTLTLVFHHKKKLIMPYNKDSGGYDKP